MGLEARTGQTERPLYLPEHVSGRGDGLVVQERKPLFIGKGGAAYQRILDQSQGDRFLIVNAHADDEFPAAGLISRLKGEQRMVADLAVFTASEGEDLTTDRVIPGERMRGIRQQELLAAAEVIGVTRIYQFNEPDGRLRPDLRLALGLATVIREVKPALMIVPSGDPREHPDHIAAFEISRMARKLAAHSMEIEGSRDPHKVSLFVEEEVMHVNPGRFIHLVDTGNQVDHVVAHQRAYGTQVGGQERYQVFFDKRVAFNGARIGVQKAEAYRVSNGEFTTNGLDLPPKYHPVAHPTVIRA